MAHVVSVNGTPSIDAAPVASVNEKPKPAALSDIDLLEVHIAARRGALKAPVARKKPAACDESDSGDESTTS